MKTSDVPQHAALFDGLHEVCYAQDDSGRLVPVPSAGWEPSNIANIQAWYEIAAQVETVAEKVRAGRLSPLAYHMERNQMDVGLVAAYTGWPRWRIRRHRNPRVFRRLAAPILARYADVFRMSVEEFCRIPEHAEIPIPGGSGPAAP